tara:strand:+ start:1373 stop:1588 length:216 start_codon:yes stop_codon:yes gene_type:complete
MTAIGDDDEIGAMKSSRQMTKFVANKLEETVVQLYQADMKVPCVLKGHGRKKSCIASSTQDGSVSLALTYD